MKARTATALFVFLMSSPAMADATIAVVNQSSYDIHNLFLSASSNPSWAADQLGDSILSTGSTFTLTGIPCDTYDVKLIDADGDECILRGIGLCEDTEAWPIDDSALLGCQAMSQ